MIRAGVNTSMAHEIAHAIAHAIRLQGPQSLSHCVSNMKIYLYYIKEYLHSLCKTFQISIF